MLHQRECISLRALCLTYLSTGRRLRALLSSGECATKHQRCSVHHRRQVSAGHRARGRQIPGELWSEIVYALTKRFAGPDRVGWKTAEIQRRTRGLWESGAMQVPAGDAGHVDADPCGQSRRIEPSAGHLTRHALQSPVLPLSGHGDILRESCWLGRMLP